MKLFLIYLVTIFSIAGVSNSYARGQVSSPVASVSTEGAAQQIADLKLQQQQQFIYFGIAIAVLLLLLLFYIYRNYTLQKKATLDIQAAQNNTEQQRLKVEKLEQFEQKFLASMSHEMRTPMNTVMGMTDLTLDTELTPKQKKYLTAVKKSSENLLVIINDALDRGKLEARKTELENIQFNLGEVVKDIADTVKISAGEKGLKMETQIAGDVPDLLTGDPSRLRQVLMNLCGNAIKFSEKGIVKISVEKVPGTDATLQFRVTDTGTGMPDDKVGDLFDSFLHADPGTWHKYDEKDLRLSIAKKLVELQGGKIELKSEKGKGAEFFFTIAYGLADEKAAIALSGIKILVAEDNEYNQVVIMDTLETLIPGVHVDTAENGKIVIEKHLTNDYDIILMDVQMPEMDGLEATALIRKTKEGKKKDIPIIALTAGVLNNELDECFNAGMNDYIPKPFTREHLLNTLAKFYKKGLPVNEVAVKSRGIENKVIENKVTDLAFLQDFCKGDKVAMKKYIDIYLKVTPGNLEKINSQLAENDYAAIARVVHAMKAHLNYMGMKQTRKTAESIESQAKEQNNLKELPQLINKLQEDCKQSMEELRLFV